MHLLPKFEVNPSSGLGGDAEQIHRYTDTQTEGARSHNKNIDAHAQNIWNGYIEFA